jgi:hypothetical protein
MNDDERTVLIWARLAIGGVLFAGAIACYVIAHGARAEAAL